MLPIATKRGKKFSLFLLPSVAVFVFAALLALAGVYQVESRTFNLFNGLPGALLPLFWAVSLFGTLFSVGLTALVAGLYKKTALAFKLLMAGTGAYIASSLLKMLAIRVRPEELLQSVIVRENTLGTYGFPSSHAAVAAALATVLCMNMPKTWRLPIILVTLLVLVSRMYLGVHLPLDLIGGACVGVLIGYLVAFVPISKKL